MKSLYDRFSSGDVINQRDGIIGGRAGQHSWQHLAAFPNGVPLEYSIEWLTCAVASRLDAVMVG